MSDLPKGPPPPSTSSPDPATRSTTFQPVGAGEAETQSGGKLVVEAYAAIWAFVFVFVALAWARQRRVDQRVDELEVELAKARRDAARSKVEASEATSSEAIAPRGEAPANVRRATAEIKGGE